MRVNDAEKAQMRVLRYLSNQYIEEDGNEYEEAYFFYRRLIWGEDTENLFRQITEITADLGMESIR